MNSANIYSHTWRIHGELYEFIKTRAREVDMCTAVYLAQIIYCNISNAKGKYRLHVLTDEYVNRRGQRPRKAEHRYIDHQIAIRNTSQFETLFNRTVLRIARQKGYRAEEYEEYGDENEYARVISRMEKELVTSCILDEYIPLP